MLSLKEVLDQATDYVRDQVFIRFKERHPEAFVERYGKTIRCLADDKDRLLDVRRAVHDELLSLASFALSLGVNLEGYDPWKVFDEIRQTRRQIAERGINPKDLVCLNVGEMLREYKREQAIGR